MYNEIVKEKFNKLLGKADSVVLGIESSCDETAAAVTVGGRTLLSSVISSQIDIHKLYGGVVPEIASRNHTQAVMNVINESLKKANLTINDLDAIAVTFGAGLIGALLVGVSAAKALSFAANIPLIKVNHIQGHIFAALIENKTLEPPFLGVVTSGGHTSLVEVSGYNQFRLIGSSVDDAIGEAFDKVARILGLEYPGGPNVDKHAKQGKSLGSFFKVKRHVNDDFSFSYSGLKTAVVNYVHSANQRGDTVSVPDVCLTFTMDAIDTLAPSVIAAAKKYDLKNIVLCGGVAANSFLRAALKEETEKNGFNLFIPSPILCTDNAAMISCRGFYSCFTGDENALADLTLNAVSTLK